jgi:hypothetical protein
MVALILVTPHANGLSNYLGAFIVVEIPLKVLLSVLYGVSQVFNKVFPVYINHLSRSPVLASKPESLKD